MKDHKGNLASVRVYTISGVWRVGYFGRVACGNGLYTFGWVKEIICASKEEADKIAQAS